MIDNVVGQDTDRSLGARPLRRAFERLVEGPIASQILAGNIRTGSRLTAACDRRGGLILGLA